MSTQPWGCKYPPLYWLRQSHARASINTTAPTFLLLHPSLPISASYVTSHIGLVPVEHSKQADCQFPPLLWPPNCQRPISTSTGSKFISRDMGSPFFPFTVTLISISTAYYKSITQIRCGSYRTTRGRVERRGIQLQAQVLQSIPHYRGMEADITRRVAHKRFACLWRTLQYS